MEYEKYIWDWLWERLGNECGVAGSDKHDDAGVPKHLGRLRNGGRPQQLPGIGKRILR